MNEMKPLVMYLASPDSNSGSNGIAWVKRYVSPNFDHCDQKECNVAIDNTLSIT